MLLHSQLRLGAIVLTALTLLGGAGIAVKRWQAAQPAGDAAYIVVLRDGTDAQAVATEHASTYGLTITHVYEQALRGYAARLTPTQLARIRSDPRVQYVEEDGPVHALS
jgi:subtilisin